MKRVSWPILAAALVTSGLVFSAGAPDEDSRQAANAADNHNSTPTSKAFGQAIKELFQTGLARSVASMTTGTSSTLSFSALVPFTYMIGGAPPTAQRLDITANGDDAVVPFLAKPDPWITVRPSLGSTPSSAQVSVDPTGFAPGSYTGGILFQGSFSDVRLPVRLNVTGPSLAASPARLAFQVDTPGDKPPAQSLQVSASPNVDFKVSVATTAGGNWLKSDTAAATTPATIAISTDSSNLNLGSYGGTVTISSAGLTPQVIPVTLGVGPATFSLTATPRSVAFAYQKGDSPPAPQQVQIGGTNGLQFNSSVSSANWLTVAPISGTVPSALNLSANPVGLGAGTYSGTVNVIAQTAATQVSQQIAVSLTVATPPPPTSNASLIVIPDNGLLFTYTIDQQKPPDQFVQVTSSGSPITFSAVPRVTDFGVPNWLAVSPRTGATTSTLTVSVNPAGLKIGAYNGQITIAPNDKNLSVVTLPILLTVAAVVPSQLQTDMTQITAFAGDSTAPQLTQLTVRNPGSNFLSFSVQTQTDAGGPWLSASRSSSGADATDPAAIVVKTDPSGLAAGTYTGSVIIVSSHPDYNSRSAYSRQPEISGSIADGPAFCRHRRLRSASQFAAPGYSALGFRRCGVDRGSPAPDPIGRRLVICIPIGRTRQFHTPRRWQHRCHH